MWTFPRVSNSSSTVRPYRPYYLCPGCPTAYELSALHNPRVSAVDRVSPRLKCPHDYDTHYCLNEGICFMQKNVFDKLTYYCKCEGPYLGKRCEYFYIPQAYERSASPVYYGIPLLLGSVGILFVACLLLCVAAFLFVKRQSKHHSPSLSDTTTATPSTPGTILIQTPHARIAGNFVHQGSSSEWPPLLHQPNQEANSSDQPTVTMVELSSPPLAAGKGVSNIDDNNNNNDIGNKDDSPGVAELFQRKKSPKKPFRFSDEAIAMQERTQYFSFRDRLNGTVEGSSGTI